MQLSYQTISLALMIMGLTVADFSSSCTQVKNSADSIKSKVDAWSAKEGLVAALDIQSAFGGLNSAVSTLSNDAHKVSASDIQVPAINALSSSIAGLLQSLAKKQSDFQQVSAKEIVSNDISTMSKPTLDIIGSLSKAVQSDCSKARAIQPSLKNLGTSFNAANSAYGLGTMNFPSEVPCKADKNSDSQSSGIPSNSGASSSGASSSVTSSVSASQNPDAPSTVYSTAYVAGPPPSSNASPVPDMGSMSSMGSMDPMGSMPMPMPTDSASSPSSASPGQQPPPPMPFAFPNRNSTTSGVQPSVAMSNGAESLSGRAVLAVAVIGPAVALLM